MKTFFKKTKGFTLVELMVSVGIFALMTTFLLAKYGTFNQSVLLTNLAYDVALTIRNAQSYGLNVRSVPGEVENFDTAYGVHFSEDPGTNFTFFFDPTKTGTYNASYKIGEDFIIKRGSRISNLCVSDDPGNCTTEPTSIDISFNRPDPDAIIKANGGGVSYRYAQITLTATDGSVKRVEVRSTGQIAVTN